MQSLSVLMGGSTPLLYWTTHKFSRRHITPRFQPTGVITSGAAVDSDLDDVSGRLSWLVSNADAHMTHGHDPRSPAFLHGLQLTTRR